MSELNKNSEANKERHRRNRPSDLHSALALVCPIDGVSIGNWDDRTTWRIDFKPEATAKQRKAAQAVLDSLNLIGDENPEDVGAPRVIR